jgi:hypothetical protein
MTQRRREHGRGREDGRRRGPSVHAVCVDVAPLANSGEAAPSRRDWPVAHLAAGCLQ